MNKPATIGWLFRPIRSGRNRSLGHVRCVLTEYSRAANRHALFLNALYAIGESLRGGGISVEAHADLWPFTTGVYGAGVTWEVYVGTASLTWIHL